MVTHAAKLTDAQKTFLRLVERSMKGQDWAKVGMVLFKHTKTMSDQIPHLVEFDEAKLKIRPTSEGYAILGAMKIL